MSTATLSHRQNGRRPPERNQPSRLPLERFLDRAIRGLDSGKEEIAIGLGRVSQIGARVAPRHLFSLVNRGD